MPMVKPATPLSKKTLPKDSFVTSDAFRQTGIYINICDIFHTNFQRCCLRLNLNVIGILISLIQEEEYST